MGGQVPLNLVAVVPPHPIAVVFLHLAVAPPLIHHCRDYRLAVEQPPQAPPPQIAETTVTLPPNRYRALVAMSTSSQMPIHMHN
ncbi:hypothetical protein E2562_016614 [Oryza meyeriana var. granulata]|uniref:Uncharacterized protein n=1 Tax=Oryza meyeriana var. granulata TaxID=110450 RepID=A0A6G1EL80_9ORYZ|nr:hypothetical protein E2562_016614 [Oryza meyeriana var. granulata]